ncbi:glycosyltransferase family 8 protein [Ancylobacter sp. 6x-1]|uniref:Glycosyltransferase family 8 protein n=1 Tax=Ancylobacter crimeensis TaxID=2579147 RepID=A0ABT0D9Y2_9HYPH|nr:glycosyltransferase family 8 protein [Ancylobacter crimeensis]MCK0196768.1 glycosyltransferase family 8 protein [Ancylobacter crimeensis]
MILATATDAGYVELTAVLLASLALQAGEKASRVVVFCDGVSAQDKAKLAASYGREGLSFLDLTDAELDRFGRLPVSRHLSRTAYARVVMPMMLAQERGRLLYLDCDTVVNHPLDALETLGLGGHAFGAVEDAATPERRIARNRRVGLPDATPYFNSGVLLIDLDRWRAAGLTERVFAFAASRPDLPMMDQDALNGAVAGDWAPLGETWNMHRPRKASGADDPLEVWEAAHVVHFVGQEKPNYTDCRHPARDLFLRYRARSAFANAPLKSRLSRKIAKRVAALKRRMARLKAALGLAGQGRHA